MTPVAKTSKFKTLASSGFVLPSGTETAYESGRQGRRMSQRFPSNAGPTYAVTAGLHLTRSRSRDLVRNTSIGSAAIRRYTSNIVGTGIKPRWRLDDESLKEEIQELWEDWTEEADAYEQTDFYGLQELIARTEFQSGEALVRFRPRRNEDGLSVPLQLQVIEPDHLDAGNLPPRNGNQVINGIELNGIGKRVAYHLSRNHPGDFLMLAGNAQTSRVPASEVLHIYQMWRPGQLRGIPHLAPVLADIYEFDEYDDAERVRKKMAALFAAFITKRPSDTDLDTEFGRSTEADDHGQPVSVFEPGIIQELSEGEDIRFSNPADVGSSYKDWVRDQLHRIAAGIGLTHEQLTGDLSGVNYSSIRAGLLEFRREMEMLQYNMLVFQLCQKVKVRWLDTAVLSGALNIQDFVRNRRKYRRVDWYTPGWDWVDPVKDQLGDQMAIRNGLATRDGVNAKRGKDVEKIDKQNKKDQDRADQMKLIYDTDPRQTNKSGALHRAEQLALLE